MGTWGRGILQDDVAKDVYDEYLEEFDGGHAHSLILSKLRKSWVETISDSDEGPVFWHAVALAQWECGALSQLVLKKNERLIKGDAGLDRWEEVGRAKGRKNSLMQFLLKLKRTNRHPRKRRPYKGPSKAQKAERTRSISEIAYPFTPTTNALLRPGQFWAVPLSNRKFACGRVLQLPPHDSRYGNRAFFAGLMDWISSDLPTADSIAGATLLDQGSADIKTILATGKQVLGFRPLKCEKIKPFRQLSAEFPPCEVVEGFTTIRPAKASDFRTLTTYSGWGYKVIEIRAEQYFYSEDTESI